MTIASATADEYACPAPAVATNSACAPVHGICSCKSNELHPSGPDRSAKQVGCCSACLRIFIKSGQVASMSFTFRKREPSEICSFPPHRPATGMRLCIREQRLSIVKVSRKEGQFVFSRRCAASSFVLYDGLSGQLRFLVVGGF